jgi:hypothetical protein
MRDGWRGPSDDGDPPTMVAAAVAGTVEGETLRGDRATAPIENVWCRKIRGCSYRGRGASYSMAAMRRKRPNSAALRHVCFVPTCDIACASRPNKKPPEGDFQFKPENRWIKQPTMLVLTSDDTP